MYPENPKETQVIVGSMNMGYISDIARNRTHNLFRPKREPIPLDHSDGQSLVSLESLVLKSASTRLGIIFYEVLIVPETCSESLST